MKRTGRGLHWEFAGILIAALFVAVAVGTIWAQENVQTKTNVG